MSRLRILCLWLGVGALMLSGCARDDIAGASNELDDPTYQRGKELLRQGLEDQALAAFLKLVNRRGDLAPESHLELGILYEQHMKDPIAAIYHYRKYRELRPNSPQSDLVRQRIDAAMREFARTLPAQPLDNQLQRVDLLDTIERLKRENQLLKEQVALQQASGTNIPLIPASSATATPTNSGLITSLPLGGNTLSIQPTQPLRQETTTQTAPATPTATAGRTHTVVKGDTLFSLSQRYYGSQSRWRDIYSANRQQMRSENDLQIGMVLTIP